MTNAQVIETQLRVTSIRSRGASGGVIFAGKSDSGDMYVVVAEYSMLPDSSVVEIAQVWKVAGTKEVVSYNRDGVLRYEIQIKPTQLDLMRPSGKNLIAWISNSQDCKGIGDVRARKLFEKFGTELVTLIELGATDVLAEVIGQESAESLIAAFAKSNIAQTLLWLDRLGLNRSISTSIAQYWGKDGQRKVEENPYVLISFCVDWETVDELARSRFGIKPEDTRRLVGAAEDALYRRMEHGDTALSRADARVRLSRVLGSTKLADQSLEDALKNGTLSEAGDLIQTPGLAYIETNIAHSLTLLLAGGFSDQGEFFTTTLPPDAVVKRHLALYESSQKIELTPEQQDAVLTSAVNRVSLILGGAGTGKTTVLKALCRVLERVSPGVQIHQFALAGRAAQRMAQSTGRPAKTIAAFLNDVAVSPGSTVLIDEVSMVDVILMYRVLKHLPSGVRLVLIGDPAQLPPIGPGLVLHALEGQAEIPQTTLKTVKRQTAASGIPQVAAAVRQKKLPLWARYSGRGSGVSAISCDEQHLNEKVVQTYHELGGNGTDYSVQVLSTTKRGHGGVISLNTLLHERFAQKTQQIRSAHPEYGFLYERTSENIGLYAGDLVIYGANDYTLGLRNGSLGQIIRPVTSQSSSQIVCIANFEGEEYELTVNHLQHMTHSYAVTTHKAQGSQFERVIVPIRRNRILDNALLYTAITRGVEQVVIIGDIAAVEEAICAASNASRRTTRLGQLLLKTVA